MLVTMPVVKKYFIITTLISAIITLPVGWLLGNKWGVEFFSSSQRLVSPFIRQDIEKKLPLLKYSLNNATNYNFQPSTIAVGDLIDNTPTYNSYLFSYQTLGKTMTGQLNIPHTAPPQTGYPVVIMIRGWVPAEIYSTGMGTKSAAAVLAENGYVTLAPDFFGFGNSDDESSNSWEARFQKPFNIIELLATINNAPQLNLGSKTIQLDNQPDKRYIWAHSNGGQIALAALEISGQPIKTTLWAPVTAPFPYSILFFSDEHDDEGKNMRKWLSLFEQDYNVADFTITQHLDRLHGSIQIHQGTADDAVPVAWNDEFVEKIKLENEARSQALKEAESGTQSAQVKLTSAPIQVNYFKYPGANHNLQPSWNTAIQRDLVFFNL